VLGRHSSGELGDGTTTGRSAPAPVQFSGQAAVGVPSVADPEVMAQAGVAFDYTAGWEVTAPLVWRDLDRALIILHDDSNEGEGLIITFQEREGADSTLEAGESALISLNVDASRIEGSGPDGRTVTLVLNLTFAPEAAGKTYTVEIVVQTDNGDSQLAEVLGTLTVE